MARELISKTIDGKLYEFQQMGPKQSLKMLARLTNLIGEPVLLTIAGGWKGSQKDKKGDESKIDNDLIGKAIKELVGRMADSGEVISLIEQLTTQGVLCDHKQISFDVHFDEHGLGHLFNVVKAALEAQYGNFIVALFDAGGLSLPKSPSQGIQSV